jgi:hypothetical protein
VVTNTGGLPVKEDYGAKMDGLKQTFEDEWVALSVFTQVLLQSVKSTGSDDVRIVGGVRTLNRLRCHGWFIHFCGPLKQSLLSVEWPELI